MVGRGSLAAVAASALLLSGGNLAFAHDEIPSSDTALVEVYVNSEADVDALVSAGFDLAEYKRVEADGKIVVNIDADPGERSELRAKGFTIGRTVEDAAHREAVAAERDATREQDQVAKDLARNGVPAGGAKIDGRRAVPLPGETVIQRANRFTNYAGTFLYVEAHNKATTARRAVVNNRNVVVNDGPVQALSFSTDAGATYGDAVTMNIFNDGDVTPPVYMYHRHLIRLTAAQAAVPAGQLKVRVASASGAADEFPVTEWLGETLPPHVANYQQGFFNRYQDPTENRAQLDQLAAEFPELVTPVNLPHLSVGYQRKAQTVLGAWAGAGTTQNPLVPFTNQTGNLTAAEGARAIILTSKDWGHQGGNGISARLTAPTTADQALRVTVAGRAIVVSLATNAQGAVVSTAKDVVDAINANAAATALVTASTYRGNAGAGIPRTGETLTLRDYLNAPSHVQKGPFQQRVYRIGKHRDGSKVGVFLYCQQHAREWTTGLTCVETAERLVRNYGLDARTKELLDNVEVFVLANVNPDGAHYSMYDFNSQRRNMSNHCAPNTFQDPLARNAWGVDLNRNNGEYSRLDGYAGADSSCVSDVFSGNSEYSEPEIQNEKWVVDEFENIKFANNIHSYGGYFMWAPGAYKNDGNRTTAPAPNIGIEKYFFEAGEQILARIKEHRNTVILPERTGPIADVLYSAAGNSADDQWYRKGIISYSFETGADRFLSTSEGTTQQATGFQPCFSGLGTGGQTGTCNSNMINEGRDQAMEFASGNFGMVESAYDYAKDTTAPKTSIEFSAKQTMGEPINFRFNWDDEAAVIYYTTDGSTPTLSSRTYEAQRARGIGEVLTISALGVHDVKWMAVDIKGNQSPVQSQRLLIAADQEDGTVGGSVPATLALNVDGGSFGQFIPGVAQTYTAESTATVISTAGNATLTVADQSANKPGHLVNGAFSLAQPLQGLGVIKTWDAPVSNDRVTVTLSQAIGRDEPLRTGAYSKTLTYTLSTTQP
ncbi:chitobiase/beta-hexosaminidase C-terminal domain-containing protein [Solirubrobacter sp. CPCC 204708]|uniref:M14 family metallopeptidase n=1 Tax=Solirubrobacter deserti TaxID=2282478 RepID=A0ABT4RM92_9ACTN|nr:M14 family metallopeptidase [Solirubrobacter deserti]MBE2318009.1 chitobiase/beta-hexosaminidase C-terminal domain-containing protein [Solirubrobacter deserti]MDA0139688.1 M14 family metallopeptidase [Solirubrobacter deserti]